MARSSRRTRACTCSACNRVVDAAEATCPRCGATRPEAGWTPLGIPLPSREKAVGKPPDRPLPPDLDDEPSGAVPPPPADAAASADDAPDPATSPPVLRRDVLPEDVFDFAPDNVIAINAPRAPVRKAQPLMVRVGPPRPDEMLPAGEAPDAEEATDERPPDTYAGRYRLEEALPAAPGVSRHLAVQEPAVRRVVLTVLKKSRTEEAQLALESRFLREARVLARLRHPCLAPVYDVGRASDGTCYATEEVPYGPSLRELAESKDLPPERTLGLAANLAGALAAMHEAGVVHRAVRSDSVFVAPGIWRANAGAEAVQLGGYGWHVTPEDVGGDDDAERALATAPEVVAGQEPDEAADLYAVGVILHLALLGRPVHVGTAAEIRAASGHAAVRLARTADRLTNRLLDIAERCLAPSPDHRHPSARALLRELEELGRPAVAPVVAPPPPGLSFGGVAVETFAGAMLPTVGILAFLAWNAPTRTVYLPASTPPVPTATVPPVAPPAPPEPTPVVEPAPVEAASPEAAPTPTPTPAAPPTAAPGDRATAAPEYGSAPVASEGRRRRSSSLPTPTTEPSTTPITTTAPADPAPAAAIAPAVAPPPPATPTPAPPPVAAAEPTPPAPAKETRPTVPGATALSGLWLGRAPGGTLALDLQVASDGSITGRVRRSDRPDEATVVGRVSSGGRVELQVTDTTGTESWSGELTDGGMSGRITAGGRAAGRFTARR